MVAKCFWLVFTLFALVKADSTDQWEEPHAWRRANHKNEYLSETNSCPACGISDKGSLQKSSDVSSMQDKISYIYYKKLITSLFDRKNYQYDAITETFTRGLILSATEKQLQLLEESTDPRDWDAVISKLLVNSRTPPNCEQRIFDVFSIFQTFSLGFSLSSEVHFLLLATAAILAIIYLHKRYNYSLIVITLSGFFIFGFVFTYLDCNRKLEIEEMAGVFVDANDPCATEDKQSFMWRIFNYFRSDAVRKQCTEHLKTKHKIKLPFCRPDEVFLIYVNDIILNQFKLIIEKCTEIIIGTSETFPFPYNIFAMLIFGFTLTTFLKLTFKHIISPKVWLSGFTGKASKQQHDEAFRDSASGGDKISGENLKLLLEGLKYSGRVTVEQLPNTSGVEVIEHISYDKESEGKAEVVASSSKGANGKDEWSVEDLHEAE